MRPLTDDDVERLRGCARCDRAPRVAKERLVCRFGFERIHLQRIQLMCDEDNLASIKVAYSAGFSREGLLRSYGERDGKRHKVVLHSLPPSDQLEI